MLFLVHAGILFLSSKPLVMNAMARALTQTVDEMPLNAMLPLTVSVRDRILRGVERGHY